MKNVLIFCLFLVIVIYELKMIYKIIALKCLTKLIKFTQYVYWKVYLIINLIKQKVFKNYNCILRIYILLQAKLFKYCALLCNIIRL